MDLPWVCPICRPKRAWKSDACPHSVTEIEQRVADDHVRGIVREELKKR